ncbi:MAG: hypothetical protein ACREX4_24015, partial [Gammaproteobacteria bacterium]
VFTLTRISHLVRSGLDLLSWPTVVFLQSGCSIYTLQQAALADRAEGGVHFLGYGDTAQTECLQLLAKKIPVTQSTSRDDKPETGLDVLN